MRPPIVSMPRFLKKNKARREHGKVAPVAAVNSITIMGETVSFDGMRPLTLRQCAVHEACHVVVARLLGFRAAGVYLGRADATVPEAERLGFDDAWIGQTTWRDALSWDASVAVHLAPELHPESGGLGDGDVASILGSHGAWRNIAHARRLVRDMASVALPEIEALADMVMQGKEDRRAVSFLYDWRGASSEVSDVRFILREGDAWRLFDEHLLKERDANQRFGVP